MLYSVPINHINDFNMQAMSPTKHSFFLGSNKSDNKEVVRTSPFTTIINSLPFFFSFSTNHSTAIPSGSFRNPEYTYWPGHASS